MNTTGPGTKHKGFTLIELLTVVATIAVLAAIAVPNFLEAQIRAKTARTKSDMAVLVASLRAYYSDYNTYPPNHPELRRYLEAVAAYPSTAEAELSLQTPDDALISWTGRDSGASTRPLHALGQRADYGGENTKSPMAISGTLALPVLTTPVRYLTSDLPPDPYARNWQSQGTFCYINPFDVSSTTATEAFERAGRRYVLISAGPDTAIGGHERESRFHPLYGPFVAYDPTNGTVSQGDILEFGNWSVSDDPPGAPVTLPPASPGPGTAMMPLGI